MKIIIGKRVNGINLKYNATIEFELDGIRVKIYNDTFEDVRVSVKKWI